MNIITDFPKEVIIKRREVRGKVKKKVAVKIYEK